MEAGAGRLRGSESESPREQGLLGSLLSVNAETFSVANFVHALRRRWMLAVAVAVVVLAAVAVYTALQKPMYEARGIIQFDPRPPQPLGQSVSSVIQVGADTFVESVQFVTTQAAIIKSSRLSETVAHSLGLERNAAFLAQSRPGEVVQPREVSVRSAASRLIGAGPRSARRPRSAGNHVPQATAPMRGVPSPSARETRRRSSESTTARHASRPR